MAGPGREKEEKKKKRADAADSRDAIIRCKMRCGATRRERDESETSVAHVVGGGCTASTGTFLPWACCLAFALSGRYDDVRMTLAQVGCLMILLLLLLI